MLYQQFNNDTGDRAPRQSPAGIRIGVGAQIAQTKLNTKVGNVTQTNRKLDFALTKENQYFTFYHLLLIDLYYRVKGIFTYHRMRMAVRV